MKKAVKYIGVLLLAAILCVVYAPVNAKASGDVVLKIGSAKGEAGDEITIPISISNSGEVAGLDLTAIYDPEELSFIDASKGESVKSGDICDINHVANKNYVRFIFTSLTEIPSDGEVMELKFRVLNNENEEHTIDLDVRAVHDMDIAALDWKTEGGREIAPVESIDSPDNGTSENTSSGQGSVVGRGQVEQQTDSFQEDTSDRENTADSRMESDGTEKRFIVMTEDGLKDVTDTTARETSENLSSGSGSTQEASGRKPAVMIGIVAVVILLLAVSGGVILRTHKKGKGERKNK